jgi:hypothetical protein
LYGVSIDLIEDLDSDEFAFEIEVVDQAGHRSSCMVTIIVAENKIIGALKWSSENYTAQIKENSPEDTHLIQIKAEPIGKDLNNEIPLKIGYKLADQNPYFKIDEQTGELKTSGEILNREETMNGKLLKQQVIFVQALMEINSSITVWSSIERINVKILDELDEAPFFILPNTNQTQIAFQSNPVFKFEAIDTDLNDTLTYTLVNQYRVYKNVSLNLPFVLDSETGELNFEPEKMTDDLYASLFIQTESKDLIRVRLSVSVVDSTNRSAQSEISVDLKVSHLLNQVADRLVLELKNRTSSTTTTQNEENSGVLKINENGHYCVDEDVPVNTTLFRVGTSLSNFFIS